MLDPFVGTGSLLIPPSHFGALCFGHDLDSRVIHGSGVGNINKKSTFYKKGIENEKPLLLLNFK